MKLFGKDRFPFVRQPDSMDCGPACLSMITKYYGKEYSLDYLRQNSFIGKDGVSLLGISRAAEQIGFRTIGGRVTFDNLTHKALLPCIAHWRQEHFVVIYDIKKTDKKESIIRIADPGKGLVEYTAADFRKNWVSTQTYGEEKGVVLLL